MAYNGSGTFLINTAGQPVVAGTVISSTTFNSLTADLATGLSTVITKDGQTTVTANIPMASFKFTGLGVGSAAGDSANLSQVQSTVTKLLTSVSGTDTITAVGAPVVAAYAAGQMFYFVATGDNTTSVTINIDGLGAKAVTRDGSVALVAGDIKSGEVVVVVYDGTRFQVVSQLNSAGDARFANVSIASSLYVGGVSTFVGNAGFSANVSITSALNVGGVATFSAGTAAAPSITTTGDTNTGIFFPAADTIAFTEGGVEAARFDSSGNLGLGVTPSAWGSSYRAFQIGAGGSVNAGSSSPITYVSLTANTYIDGTPAAKYIGTGEATNYQQVNGQHQFYTAASGTAGNAITFTQAMTLTAAGDLGVGVTSPSARVDVRSAIGTSVDGAQNINAIDTTAYAQGNGGGISFGYVFNSSGGLISRAGVIKAIKENSTDGNYASALTFSTTANSASTTERARITSDGIFLVGKTTTSLANEGVSIESNGTFAATRSGAQVVLFNRNTNDGIIVSLRQDQNEEGNISVSGSTVSYNGGHLSRYSQTTDNTQIPLLKGTVMTNLDQMAVWEKDGQPLPNEQLNCMKVSDVEGDVNVAGVFVNWDNDDDVYTNDMNIAMTGDMIIRVAQGVVVQRGELLMSAGDGTAKPQGEDIIRSKTVAKVTSNHVTCTYDDGSYCVPCVLMAC